MIAARPLHSMTRGVGRNALDLPVAALAGLAVAFVTFAMPTDLLNQLVGASHVSSLLSAAEPPLGFKARAGVGLAGAFAAFGLVFVLLRLIDRTGLDRPQRIRTARAPEVPAAVEVDVPVLEPEDLPRLRRRDAHPDAPARRPISATRDFGEPAPPFHAAEPAPVPQVWPEAAEEEPLDLASVAEEPEPIIAQDEPAFVPDPPEEPAAPAADASLDDLMRRLEQGLARRQTRTPIQPQSPPMAAPHVFPEPREDRLQSAIESLQRYNARGD